MRVQFKSYLITVAGRNKISYFHHCSVLRHVFRSLIHITASKSLIKLYFLTSSAVLVQNKVFLVNIAKILISSDLKLHDAEGHSVWVELFSAAHMTCL